MNASRTLSAAALAVLLGGTLAVAGCAGDRTSTSFGETVDDGVITSKVKAKMVKDPDVSALNIQVETYKGTVQLSGFANNAAEIDRAVEIARDTEGVKAVKNDIRLKTAQ